MKTNYPDSLTIQQYLEGKLDPEMAHQLEKQALDDPFLWEALEGYSAYRDPAADLSILQRQLHERIVHMQENKKVFDLSWQRLSVAAAAAVMFIAAGILFWMNSHRAPEQLASQSQKPVEVNVIDRDSVDAVIKSKNAPVIASLEKKETDLSKPNISEYKPASAVSKRAVISPEATTYVLQDSVYHQDTENIELLVDAARPKSGWKAYHEYLTVNTRKFKTEPALEGTVWLSFEIDSTGRPLNVKVLKGLNSVYDREAIRIVKHGSEWLPIADGKKIEQQIEVKFGL